MKKAILTLVFLLSCFTLGAQTPQVRDYNAPLTEVEKGHIRYIINTLSQHSAFNLIFYKNKLEERGNHVSHVHPLKFFKFVFSDPQLKANVKRIKGMPWRRFTKDFADSFDKSLRNNNMKGEYFDDFSQTVGVDKSVFINSINNGNWVKFINVVRKNVQ